VNAAIVAAMALAAQSNLALAHVVLDPEQVQGLLTEVARQRHLAHDEADSRAGAESLFRLGELAEALVDLLNQDLAAHGSPDLLATLLVARLAGHGVRITLDPRLNRYAYDLAAFREYLSRAPNGPRAADARYRILAARFYALPPPETAAVPAEDATALLAAVHDAERFLRDYPGHTQADRVRFFVAVDTYRAAQLPASPAARGERAMRARRALEAVVRVAPESVEAQAARVLLEKLGARPQR
jgi:hypothetical protein